MNNLVRIGAAAAALLVVAILGYNLLPRGSIGNQPTAVPTGLPSAQPTASAASSSTTPVANPLVGTWLAPEMTCSQQVATIEAAGYTADQIAEARADLAAQGYGDGFFDCANQASAARTTNRYSIVFDGLPLAASVLSARIYDYDVIASPQHYRAAAGSTLEFGSHQGNAWEVCVTFRYTIDGDLLTFDMIQPNCTGSADAPLLDQIAFTAFLETAPFTRQP